MPRLLALVAALQARVAELERPIGLNSVAIAGNPHPAMALKKKPARISGSQRERTRQPRPADRKATLVKTLSRAETPDATIEAISPLTCSGCGRRADRGDGHGAHTARQASDLPDPQPPATTEHRAHACRCGNCGAETRAAFPGRRNRAGAIRCASRGDRGVPVALSVAARETSGRVDGPNLFRRAFWSPRRSPRMSQACAAVSGFRRRRARSASRRRSVKHMDETASELAAKRNGCISHRPSG